jgi:hypothetical protein
MQHCGRRDAHDSPPTRRRPKAAGAPRARPPEHRAEPPVLLLRHRRRRPAACALVRDRLDDDRAGVTSRLAAASLYARASPCSRRPWRRESRPRRRCRAWRALSLAAAGLTTRDSTSTVRRHLGFGYPVDVVSVTVTRARPRRGLRATVAVWRKGDTRLARVSESVGLIVCAG